MSAQTVGFRLLLACVWAGAHRSEKVGAALRHRRRRNAARSDAAALLRTAAVVRHWRHVGDRIDADAERGQRAHRRLAAGAGALDPHVEVLDALVLRSAAGNFGSHLGCERRALARAFEALATAGRP